MSDKKMRELDKAIGEINGTAGEPEDYEWPECEILMTHPGGDGTTLTDCFKHLSLDRDELKYVMFQVFYTLYVFDKIEMSHGDLHSGNIFVITLDAPREFCYKVGEKFFKFTSDKLVKIFDFDHSTICKNTRLEFGLPEPIIIEKVQNDDRMPPHGYFNTNLAETSIYNKNLDLLILYTWGLMIAAEAPKTSAETFRMAYSNFNMFSMDVLRGFSGGSRSPHVSHIQQTYNELANLSYTGGASVPLDVKRKNLRELQRVMGYPIGEDFDFDKYGISDDIAYLNWPQYLLHILRKKFGRIIKSTSQIENNTLWIPDEIVMDKFEILNHSYFSTLQVSDLSQVDATKTPIYSIEAIL
jgi:hypothetical protein